MLSRLIQQCCGRSRPAPWCRCSGDDETPRRKLDDSAVSIVPAIPACGALPSASLKKTHIIRRAAFPLASCAVMQAALTSILAEEHHSCCRWQVNNAHGSVPAEEMMRAAATRASLCWRCRCQHRVLSSTLLWDIANAVQVCKYHSAPFPAPRIVLLRQSRFYDLDAWPCPLAGRP